MEVTASSLSGGQLATASQPAWKHGEELEGPTVVFTRPLCRARQSQCGRERAR